MKTVKIGCVCKWLMKEVLLKLRSRLIVEMGVREKRMETRMLVFYDRRL